MAKRTKQTTETPSVLELDYRLAELPSSQHRAGLAGLVLMVRWLEEQQRASGICEIARLDRHGATLRLDQQGLAALFDEVYDALEEEQEQTTLRRNQQTKQIIPPVREEPRTVTDPKTGKTKEKTVYIYKGVIPRGAFLTVDDKSFDGRDGVWIKLWRNVIWTIFRGVPATRAPFEARATGEPINDAALAWQELAQPPNHVVALPSTYFIGAQANNAENVPFKDRARFQFLLHFWPFVAQIYVPSVINDEGRADLGKSFALAVPDVADLEFFCADLREVLRQRDTALAGYRPRESVVDLALESALDLLHRLRARLVVTAGAQATGEQVLGVDVLHVEKQGNNIRLWGNDRLEPEAVMIDEYAQFRGSLWNPLFRRQRLLNLVNHRVWHAGFGSLMSKLPYKQTIGNNYFRRDARESFPEEVKKMSDENTATPITEAPAPSAPLATDALIYRLVGIYLSGRLKSKHQLEWSNVKGNPAKEKDYREAREKLGREAFLAIRSRTGQDFIDYFASTLCSVGQSLNEQNFVALTKALHEETDQVRTLTMLALSARS